MLRYVYVALLSVNEKPQQLYKFKNNVKIKKCVKVMHYKLLFKLQLSRNDRHRFQLYA
jgi:hypothetical protein